MNEPSEDKLSWLQVFGSVFAAAFGVQSEKNRERDFSKGNIWVFAAAGIVFTAGFVLTVWLVVKLVLANVS